MHELSAKYGNKVRIAFKNNPLPFHDAARVASRAALAAGEQGKFWEYHDVLFAHQDALGRDALLGYAKDLGLDVVRFRDAMDADRTGAAVDADIAEAKRLSVMGTPAFFVNGRRVVGAQPLAKFEALVDQELAK
jgi:protein-disulfide isomerase